MARWCYWFRFGVDIIFLLIKTLFVFLLTIIGLVFDYLVSKNYDKAKSLGSSPSWWAEEDIWVAASEGDIFRQ